MKISHFFAVLVRLFAIGLAIYAVRQLLLLFEVMATGAISGYDVSAVFAGMLVLCPLLVSVLLWYFPLAVTAFVIREDMDHSLKPLDVQGSLVVLVLAIGLYLLYFAIADAVHWLTYWQMAAGESYSGARLHFDADSKAAMVSTGVELLMAFGLLARARSISRAMLRLAR